jgi:hypothetical protein
MVHSKEHPFLVVSRDTIQDRRLSLATLGFLVKCLALPDAWVFSIRGLAKTLDVAKDTAQRHLEALCRYGYCRREQQAHACRGRFACVNYTLFENPELAKAAESPCPKNEDTVDQGPGSPPCPTLPDTVFPDVLSNKNKSGAAIAAHSKGRTSQSRIQALYFQLYTDKTGAGRAPFNRACAGQVKNDLSRLGEAGLTACLRWLFDHPPARMRSFAYMALHTFLPEAEAAVAAEGHRRSLARTCPSCGREQEHTGTDCIFCHLPLNGGQNVARA